MFVVLIRCSIPIIIVLLNSYPLRHVLTPMICQLTTIIIFFNLRSSAISSLVNHCSLTFSASSSCVVVISPRSFHHSMDKIQKIHLLGFHPTIFQTHILQSNLHQISLPIYTFQSLPIIMCFFLSNALHCRTLLFR